MRVRYYSFVILTISLALLPSGCLLIFLLNLTPTELSDEEKKVTIAGVPVAVWDSPAEPPKHEPSAHAWHEGVVAEVAEDAKSFVFKMDGASFKAGKKVSVYGRISKREAFPRHISDEPVSMLITEALVTDVMDDSSFKAKVLEMSEGPVRAGDRVVTVVLERLKKRRR